MGFFNDPLADLFQQISLPLEVIGFGLVMLEVYRSDIIDRMEDFVDRARLWFADIPREISIFPSNSTAETREEFDEELKTLTIKDHVMDLLSLVFLLAISIAAVFIFGSITHFFLGDAPEKETFFLIAIFGVLCGASSMIALLLLLPAVVLSIFAIILKVLDRLSGGYAIASFGLLLAAIGLILEAYQVITMCKPEKAICYGLF